MQNSENTYGSYISAHAADLSLRFCSGPDHPDEREPGPEPVVGLAVAAAGAGSAARRPPPLDQRPRPLDIPARRGGPQCRQEGQKAGPEDETGGAPLTMYGT
jgi:hypothetical protein